MSSLTLSGNLNLVGNLTLDATVCIGSPAVQALVQVAPGSSQGMAPPVIMPPPPASPADPGTSVCVVNSFNQTVKAKDKPIVALGMVMQGNVPTWPGQMLPSSGNSTVMINGVPINVAPGDMAVIFPSGGSASFTSSGQ